MSTHKMPRISQLGGRGLTIPLYSILFIKMLSISHNALFNKVRRIATKLFDTNFGFLLDLIFNLEPALKERHPPCPGPMVVCLKESTLLHIATKAADLPKAKFKSFTLP